MNEKKCNHPTRVVAGRYIQYAAAIAADGGGSVVVVVLDFYG